MHQLLKSRRFSGADKEFEKVVNMDIKGLRAAPGADGHLSMPFMEQELLAGLKKMKISKAQVLTASFLSPSSTVGRACCPSCAGTIRSA